MSKKPKCPLCGGYVVVTVYKGFTLNGPGEVTWIRCSECSRLNGGGHLLPIITRIARNAEIAEAAIAMAKAEIKTEEAAPIKQPAAFRQALSESEAAADAFWKLARQAAKETI